MGMASFNPWKDVAGKAANYLKSIYGNSTRNQSGQSLAQPVTDNSLGANLHLPGYNYNPYQIQSSDTFASIAEKNNTTEQALRAANNGMAVPPPKGSFINVPMPLAQQTAYSASNLNYDVNMRGRGYNSVYGQPAPIAGTNTNSFAGAINYGADINGIVASIQASPTAPAQIPGVALGQLQINGQPATAQSMQAAGYEYNQATQVWTLKGSAAAGNSDYSQTQAARDYAANGVGFLDQMRWDPSSKKYISIGKLIKQGRLDIHKPGTQRLKKQKGRGKNEWERTDQVQYVPPEQVVGAGATPQTVLGLHLGSG